MIVIFCSLFKKTLQKYRNKLVDHSIFLIFIIKKD
jgi:hypothetical protein